MNIPDKWAILAQNRTFAFMVSRSLKYDSIFFVHKHINIDTNTDHFTLLACNAGNYSSRALHGQEN